MVIAGPGSGKTTVLTHRVRYLIERYGVNPSDILVITFTKAAAEQMKLKFKGLSEGRNSAVTFGTFHAVFFTILKAAYNYSAHCIIKPQIQHEFVKDQMCRLELEYDDENEAVAGVLSEISCVKGEDVNIDEYESRCIPPQSFRIMYRAYDDMLVRKHLIDFDDMIVQCRELLMQREDYRRAWQNKYKYILIDEFQDINKAQFDVVRILADEYRNLFVVGDDDQSIYGFREANVELIKDFFAMIGDKNGTDVRLMENRRSTVNIVDFAAKLISFNEDRIDKKPVSTNRFGKHVEVEKCRTKDEEQEYIIRNVEALIKEDGRSANEIAILAPTNAELVEYADLLQKRGIESVSINPEPILENPRVLGAIGLVKFMLSSSELNGTMYINARDKGKAMTMTEDEIRKSMLELQNEVKEISDVSALFEKFMALDPDGNDEIYQSFLEDINTAKEEAVRKENLPEVCEYIIDFDRFGQKQTARKEKAYNGVVLSTMHSSKGKEWPVVFCSVTKLHGRDLKPEDIPEKNRLLFVACTRAKEELYISGVTIAVSTAAEDVENLFLNECLQVAGEMYGDEKEEFAS